MSKLTHAGLLLAITTLAACESPAPRGSSSGRVPPGWSTPAEAGDARPLPDDYMAFADTWARQLIQDMPHVPALIDLPYRATILFGDIVNKTDIISSVEFEMIREKIKNNLMRSRDFNDNFRFLISRAQLDELRRREVNKPVDQQRFDEQHTYLLNGTMFRVSRGDTHTYLITFQLVNFASGEIIWVQDYEGKRYGM